MPAQLGIDVTYSVDLVVHSVEALYALYFRGLSIKAVPVLSKDFMTLPG